MKIRCESCRTRYEIPNERVAGRVVKIRCKRCEFVMEVMGPTAAFDSAADPIPPTLTGVRAYGALNGSVYPEQTLLTAGMPTFVPLESQPIWWAAIAGKPHGPYTREEVVALCARGDIHARTRLWRAPWTEWERVCESAALAWAYEAVVERVGRDVAALRQATEGGEAPSDAFAEAGLVSDGEHYFPDPTLKSGWVILDEETQRYLETCARRGWELDEDDCAAGAPVGIEERGSLFPALAAASAALVLGLSGTLLFFEEALAKLFA